MLLSSEHPLTVSCVTLDHKFEQDFKSANRSLELEGEIAAQFRLLKKQDRIKFGKRANVYSPKDGQVRERKFPTPLRTFPR